jgi:hypothetical protein
VKRKNLALAFVATLAIGVGTACFDSLTVSQDQDQNHHNQVIEASPSPSPSASPSPGAGSSCVIKTLKIAFFPGTSCSGDKECTVGDKAPITATPYCDGAIDPCEGVENCAAYGQSDIRWIVPSEGVSESGCESAEAPVVQSAEVPEEQFNRDLTACKPGTFTVRAVFKDSIPGEMTGTVVAAAAR